MISFLCIDNKYVDLNIDVLAVRCGLFNGLKHFAINGEHKPKLEFESDIVVQFVQWYNSICGNITNIPSNLKEIANYFQINTSTMEYFIYIYIIVDDGCEFSYCIASSIREASDFIMTYISDSNPDLDFLVEQINRIDNDNDKILSSILTYCINRGVDPESFKDFFPYYNVSIDNAISFDQCIELIAKCRFNKRYIVFLICRLLNNSNIQLTEEELFKFPELCPPGDVCDPKINITTALKGEFFLDL